MASCREAASSSGWQLITPIPGLLHSPRHDVGAGDADIHIQGLQKLFSIVGSVANRHINYDTEPLQSYAGERSSFRKFSEERKKGEEFFP